MVFLLDKIHHYTTMVAISDFIEIYTPDEYTGKLCIRRSNILVNAFSSKT